MITQKSPSHSRAGVKLLALMLAAAGSTTSAIAAAGSWTGLTDLTWAGANWSAAPAPGAGEAATFNGAGNGNTVIDLGSGVSVGSIIFDTATAAAYTIGSGGAGVQTLTLGDTAAAISKTATVTNSQLINANLVLGTAIASTTTITNSGSTGTLTIAGTVQGGTGGTAGAKTIGAVVAANTAIVFSNSITAGGASGMNLVVNNGAANNTVNQTGTVTLSGSGTSSFSTLRAIGGGSLIIDGQTVTVSSASSYGATSSYGKMILNSGSVAFNGGLQTATSGGAPTGADGMAYIVNGGSFSASFVTLGRSNNIANFVTTAQNLGTSGFQVNGGTANVTGTVNISGANSSAAGQVSGGSLTVGGEFQIGQLAASGRNNFFQVTGGTLTVNDATNGIVIGRGTATVASKGQLLLTGGTTTAEKISFGLNGGFAGSSGNLSLNGASASLYVGSGGIVKAATNAYTESITLTQGTLGAKADWNSSLAMTLSGSGLNIKAADASNVAKNIGLSGNLTGVGGFNKTGDGTLTLSGANSYTGATTISAGTLALGAASALSSGSDYSLVGGTLDLASFSASAKSLSVSNGATVKFNLSGGGLNNSTALLALVNGLTETTDGGSYNIDFNGFTFDTVGSYKLLSFSSFSGTLTATDFVALNSTLTGVTGSFVLNGTDLSYALTAIPEPSSFALMAGVAGLGLAGLRRRRRA